MKPFYRTFTFFILMFFPAVQNFPAAEARSPWKKAPSYRAQVLQKLDFGVRNFLAGWTEVISETSENYKQKNGKINKLIGFFPAFGKGAALGVVNTAGGFLHVITAPVTILDIPLPKNGVDLKQITGGDLIVGPLPELSSISAVTERSEKQSVAATL